jgi:hypothetical protein
MPNGEAIVESGAARYRLRRFQRGPTSRLTVSSLDGTSVDRETVRRMLGGLSPLLLRRLYTIDFTHSPPIELLLSEEIAREFQTLGFGNAADGGRRAAELLARRDKLAKELETRLAGEGQASRDLDARRRELGRQIADVERESAAMNLRFRSVESALTETDTRLRYRRLEVEVERSWLPAPSDDRETRLAELDKQIARWRTALADLATQEAGLRARLANAQATARTTAAIITDERGWLRIARQLAADLTGEVSRLARANASEQCVCRDAHPRLRPVVETILRQLDVLATFVTEHEQALSAIELAAEISHLARSQAELSSLLEQLVRRRQALASDGALNRRPKIRELTGSKLPSGRNEISSDERCLAAADAEQLERRRHELEEERLAISNRLAAQEHRLRELKTQRATVDRERAALLSARSIEHVQRELAIVQQKLQHSMQENTGDLAALSAENSPRASDILAKLTNGELVRLQLVEHGRSVNVWTREGAIFKPESLSAMARDQVYLGFSLALAAAAERQGVRLPLLLDEPFLRLDAPATAALAMMLDDLCGHGQQIIVFTGKREAADRLASFGAPVFDLDALRHRGEQSPPASDGETTIGPAAIKKPKASRRASENGKRPKSRRREGASPEASATMDQNDAA